MNNLIVKGEAEKETVVHFSHLTSRRYRFSEFIKQFIYNICNYKAHLFQTRYLS